MPLYSGIHTPFARFNENDIFNKIKKLLEPIYKGPNDWAILIGNLNKYGFQIDALLIRERSIIEIEFKDYGGKITASEDGEWYSENLSTKIIISAGAANRNPFQQVKEHKQKLTEFLKSKPPFNNVNLRQISGMILFHQSIIPQLQFKEHQTSLWFFVCDPNSFLEKVSLIEQPGIYISNQWIQTIFDVLGVTKINLEEIIRKEVPPLDAELLVFMMDCSPSMSECSTYDKRKKSIHLYEIINPLLSRFKASPKSDAFRISLIYFAENAKIITYNDSSYFALDSAISKLISPDVAFSETRSTNISKVIEEAYKVADSFSKDEGTPLSKGVTFFLFTDGKEVSTSKQEVASTRTKIENLNFEEIKFACISFGSDADEELLLQIASATTPNQRRHLDIANVLSHLPDENKLFIRGHSSGSITQTIVEALRNFVEVLTKTNQKADRWR